MGPESETAVSRREFLRASAITAGVAGVAGGAAAQDDGGGTETGGGTEAGDGTETGGGTEAGGGTETGGGTEAGDGGGGGGGTVTIDMTDELVFDPDETTVAPGTTVVWENVGQVGHSVTAYEDEIPEEAEFFASGDLEDEQAARQSYPQQGDVAGGESYEHTFDVEGEYGYFCVPHEAVGMVASLTVTTEQQGGDGGPSVPTVPDSAMVIALASTMALLSVSFLSYFFLKYGGDYEAE